MFKTAILIACLAAGAPAWALDKACAAAPLAPAEDLMPPLGYVVAGAGRLYFHTAPSEACIDKKVFVVPGDRLMARTESGPWSEIEYMDKDGEMYNGWVLTQRLQFTGTLGNTDPGSIKFYEKAARDAKAGKLGSPWAK